MGLQTRRAVRRLVEDVVSEEDDGLFISCTNFASSYLIDGLEKKTGKPVVNSNQASLWYMLRQVGVTDPVEGYGSLLRKH